MVKKITDEGNYYLIIFVEGQTDKEFFKKMVAYLRKKYEPKKTVKVIYKNLQSVTNYNKAVSIFENEIIKKSNVSKEVKFKIICFYDYDVLKNPYKIKPPVNWNKLKKQLSNNINVFHIYDIKAKYSIEDWFLQDIEGLCKYLKAKKTFKLKDLKGSTGEEKIKDLFLRNSNVYQKGYNVSKFIEFLNFQTLYNKLENELKILVNCLFIDT